MIYIAMDCYAGGIGFLSCGIILFIVSKNYKKERSRLPGLATRFLYY